MTARASQYLLSTADHTATASRTRHDERVGGEVGLKLW